MVSSFDAEKPLLHEYAYASDSLDVEKEDNFSLGRDSDYEDAELESFYFPRKRSFWQRLLMAVRRRNVASKENGLQSVRLPVDEEPPAPRRNILRCRRLGLKAALLLLILLYVFPLIISRRFRPHLFTKSALQNPPKTT